MSNFKFTDANEFISNKILLVEISNNLLTLQAEILDLNIKVLEYNKHVCYTKQKILNDMSSVLKAQLDEYSEDLQKLILEQTDEINKLDENNDEIDKYILEKNKKTAEYNLLFKKYLEILEKIPDRAEVTNYKIKIDASNNCRNVHFKDQF